MVREEPPLSWRPAVRSCCCGFRTTACGFEVADGEWWQLNVLGPCEEQLSIVMRIGCYCFTMAAPCAFVNASPCVSGEGIYFAWVRCNAAVCSEDSSEWFRLVVS